MNDYESTIISHKKRKNQSMVAHKSFFLAYVISSFRYQAVAFFLTMTVPLLL